LRLRKINVCCIAAQIFSANAGKFLLAADKLPAKFDAFESRRSLLESARDVNASLQVEPGPMHDARAFGSEVHDHDHVKLFDLLISFRCKHSSARRILPNVVDDHVKHVSERFLRIADHVKQHPKLLCSGVITSRAA
jgi:hypothetical protein